MRPQFLDRDSQYTAAQVGLQDSGIFNKSVELETVIKNIRQTAVATKEKFSTEINMKEEDINLKEEYIKLKEKEIESLKKSRGSP